MSRRTLACVVVLVLLGGASLLGFTPEDDPTKSIRGVLDQQVVDWNKGDLDAFCDGYWNSPDVVFQSGANRTTGWQAMRERYRKSYQAEGKSMGTLAFSEVEIVPLSPESALARGRWGLKLPDGKTPNGLFTLVLRKFPTPQGWKIIHDHTSA